jgi:hypothetical protein
MKDGLSENEFTGTTHACGPFHIIFVPPGKPFAPTVISDQIATTGPGIATAIPAR